MKRTPVVITLAGMAALAVTGTALAAAQDDGPSPLSGIGSAVPTESPTDDPTDFPTDDSTDFPTDDSTPDDSATSTEPPLSGGIGVAEARRIALAEVGGGTVTKVESELEHGFSTWKIEVVRSGVEHDIYVDRATGDIVKADSKARDDRGGGRDDKGGDRGGHGSDDGPGDDRGGDRGGHGSDDDRGGHGSDD